MKRIITLLPAGIGLPLLTPAGFYPGSVDPGSSPYPGTNSPTVKLNEAWADDDNASYYYAWPGDYLASQALVTLQPPPTLALFEQVVFEALWDYSQHGPNNWYFPSSPPCAHGPQLACALVGRDGATLHLGSYDTILEADDNNVNMNTSSTPYKPRTVTWTLTSHPDGGPFSLDDMKKLTAGIVTNFSAGPSGMPYDNSQGSFFKARIFRFRVIVTIEDLGGFVENVRRSSSHTLRLYRSSRVELKATLPLNEAIFVPGDVVGAVWRRGGHPRGRGWGERTKSQRAVQVFQPSWNPNTNEVEYTCLDLRDVSCLGWASYRVDIPWSPELNGLAYLDGGGGFSASRSLDGWSSRPGDGVLLRVLPDYLNIGPEGTPVEGAGDVEKCLYNSNPTATGWSQAGMVSGLAITSPSGDAIVEELGYQVSARLTFDASGTGKGGVVQASGSAIAANDAAKYLSLRVGVRNFNVPTPSGQFLEFSLQRVSGAGTVYYRVSDGTWQATEQFNPIPSATAWGEVVVDHVSAYISGQSTATYKVKVGRFSTALSSCAFVAALVNIQEGTAEYGCRSPLVTLGSTITRVATVLRVENPAGKRVWDGGVGTLTYEFRPGWKSSIVGLGPFSKVLAHARHSSSEYDRLDIVTTDATHRVLRFRRHVSGASHDVSTPITTDISRAYVVRTWARWLDSEGWEELGPYAISTGFAIFDSTGALIEQGEANAAGPTSAPTLDSNAYLLLGSDGGSTSLDGFLRWWETTLSPLWAEECVWRR